MQLSTYHDIIYRTINADCPGYGYLEVFANVLYHYKEELNIEKVLLFLKLEVNNDSTEYLYFVNDQKINIDSFKLVELARQKRVIDSAREDIICFKNKTELGASHVIAFPVNPASSREMLFGIKGVVMLQSETGINISAIEQEQLFSILCSQKPKTLECPQIRESIELLANMKDNMCDILLKDKYVILEQALDFWATNQGDEKNSNHGLQHFSYWSSISTDDNNLCSLFNKNINGNTFPDVTNKDSNGQPQFVIEYFNYYKKHNNRSVFNDLIKLFNYENHIRNHLNINNITYPVDLKQDNISIVVVPLGYNPHIGFFCFYIKDIFNTPFVSKSLFKLFIKAIRQYFYCINELSIKNMLNDMTNAPLQTSKSIDFFKEITSILKKHNNADDCLLYLKNDSYSFLLVSEEDDNIKSTIHISNVQFDGCDFYLPEKYKLNACLQDCIFRALQTQKSICCYPNHDDLLSSLCVIVLKDTADALVGFILLVNGYYDTKGSDLSSKKLLYYDNIDITESCSKFIIRCYDEICSKNMTDRFLRQLRHEIPECIHVIDRNITKISTNINNSGFQTKQFQRDVNEILMNSSRIDNAVSFFSTMDFDDERFLDFPHQFNMHDFMNERIDSLREEALLHGTSIRYNLEIDTPILMVSDYYIHAIMNIIFNAIKYAAPGTCIWIQSNSKGISISDIGIQIKESEKEDIFKMGYRSVLAKNVSERGMGLGLYLAKRVLEAYGHSIDISSEFVHNRNIFAERMVSQIISKFTPKEKKEYVLFETLPQEENEVWERVKAIKKSDTQILPKYRSYINYDNKSLKMWFDYHRKFGPSFFVMEDDFFNQPVYLVTFSIIFPK